MIRAFSPLRKAFSELDNSLPDHLFDEGKSHDEGLLELINNVWKQIDKIEGVKIEHVGIKNILTLDDYLQYVDEYMTNEDSMQDKMQEWTLKEFQIYFGHETSEVQS